MLLIKQLVVQILSINLQKWGPDRLYITSIRNIEREQRRIEQHAREVKAKAQAMAIALSTIGKFVIKKKVGDGDKIFGRSATRLAVLQYLSGEERNQL